MRADIQRRAAEEEGEYGGYGGYGGAGGGRGGRKGKVVGAHLDEWETDKEDSVSIDGAVIKGLKGYANCTLSHGIDTRIPGRYRWKVKVPKGGAQMAIGKEEDPII